MADTFTKTLNLTKPEVGSSRDAWGTKWNDNADAIDKAIAAAATGASVTSLCEVQWIDTSTCRLIGKNGAVIIIDGKSINIPAAGVDFKFTTGAGVVAGNNYLVAYLDVTVPASPVIALKAVQTARTLHSKYGYATCGVDAETLVAGFYAQSDKTVRFSNSEKHFATWYGAKNRSLSGAQGSGQTGSQSYVEANVAVRVSAYMWGDRCISAFGQGSMPSNTYGQLYTAVSLDGSTMVDQIREVYGTPSGYNPSGINSPTPSGPLEPKTDGLHYVAALIRTFYTGSQAWNDIKLSAIVNI